MGAGGGPTRRVVVTENSIYLVTTCAGAMSYRRRPREGGLRLSRSPRLVDDVRHELVAWALEDELWGPPGVLSLRLWGPGSAFGIFTSPGVELDGRAMAPIPDQTRSSREVRGLVCSPDYAPVLVEAHGVIPGRPR